MIGTQKVSGGVGKGTVIETHISPEDIQRNTDATQPYTCAEECQPEPPHSTEVQEAFERTKRAGELNDMQSRRTVRQQWMKREGDMAGAPGLVGQTAIFDFKRVEE
jgi:hypothetical protein